MLIKLTKYGWPQVFVFPILILLVMSACPIIFLKVGHQWVFWIIEILLLAILIWVLSFFRDPLRIVPGDKKIFLAPADGKITDIEIVENEYIGGKARRIGIFLSIFDVHINRAPCDVRIENITYRKGQHRNAMNPVSGKDNESNDLYLIRISEPEDRLIVRQISGAIARHIVCQARAGEKLTGGQQFGMIKFGSRTELYLPAGDNIEILVRVGDKVKAGLTALARYKNSE
jgi:phosphatidylserine decarboxylase